VIDRLGALNKRMVFSAIFACSAVFSTVSCGKSGPPLPPLVKLPVAPVDLVAARQGNSVDVSFTIPASNTDGTRPANVASADVYAITAPVTVPPLSDANLLKYGTKVGTIEVKAPRDPNLTADADDPSDEVDPPEGPGLDQGGVARVKELFGGRGSRGRFAGDCRTSDRHNHLDAPCKTRAKGMVCFSVLLGGPKNTPSSIQSALSTPLLNDHLPEMRKPPFAGVAFPIGAKLDALSVSFAQYSFWNSSGHSATSRSWMLNTAQTQPADPSARASSWATASATSGRISGPPNFLGFIRDHSPAFQKSWMVSSGIRRA
jgi:hypothetical protein